jgi:hypothetical protein
MGCLWEEKSAKESEEQWVGQWEAMLAVIIEGEGKHGRVYVGKKIMGMQKNEE